MEPDQSIPATFSTDSHSESDVSQRRSKRVPTDVLLPVADIDAVYLEGKAIIRESGKPSDCGTDGEAIIRVMNRAHKNIRRRRVWKRRISE